MVHLIIWFELFLILAAALTCRTPPASAANQRSSAHKPRPSRNANGFQGKLKQILQQQVTERPKSTEVILRSNANETRMAAALSADLFHLSAASQVTP